MYTNVRTYTTHTPNYSENTPKWPQILLNTRKYSQIQEHNPKYTKIMLKGSGCCTPQKRNPKLSIKANAQVRAMINHLEVNRKIKRDHNALC